MPRDPRRDQLLDAAARLFAGRGFGATPVTAIAAAAGLTKPGVYYHVRGKVALLDAICRESIAAVLERVEADTAGDGDPVAELEAIIAAHVGYFADHPDRLAVLNREMTHLHPAQRDAVVALQRRYLDRLRGVLARGVAGGRFVALDPSVAAFLLLSMLNNLDTWYRDGAGVDYPGVIAHVQRIYLHGVLAAAAQEESADGQAGSV